MTSIDDLISGLPAREADPLRAALTDIAALAEGPVPSPSAAVLDLIDGGVRRHIRRRRAFVAAAAGALVLGGTSAAAARNALPAPAQEAIASFADDHLPVTVPHPAKPSAVVPVRPTSAPTDAPGRLRNEPGGPQDPGKLEAPGQIQKRTKPDPGAPGPARPADPGAHGRGHGSDAASDRSADKRVSKQRVSVDDADKGATGQGHGNPKAH